jgi:CRISPR-associated protein Csm1
MTDLLAASTRVALAAYLHDLGKFAERAGIEEAEKKDSDGNTLKETHKQEYCPSFQGRYSHIHAAYTAIAMDLIESKLPDIKRDDCFPFASRKDGDALRDGDSLINAAARHHRPETLLQWLIATADRAASGFERSEFDAYNRADENTQGKNYLQTRQFSLFENIHLQQRPATYEWRYPLLPLSPTSIFPVEKSKAEPANDAMARQQYLTLWQQFLQGLEAIPHNHRSNLSLWFDHFDTLWLTFTHAIPSATAGRVDGKFISIPADVALYDHSRTTAALAVALWRYHHETGKTGNEIIQRLNQSEEEASEPKLLLIQGDMFGIQDFIFATGGGTQKFAAKLLRGRSFYVSLLTECAALKIMDALALPPTSQVTNAAGKFLIVAPNTPDTLFKLAAVREEIDGWFLQHSQGRAGIGVAHMPASIADFRHGNTQSSPFKGLMEKLFRKLETAKLQRFDLCRSSAPAVFTSFLDNFDNDLGVCRLDNLSPAVTRHKNVEVGALAKDQVTIGECLANKRWNRLLISRQPWEKPGSDVLLTDIFGYHLKFTPAEEISGKFGQLAQDGTLARIWDFSLPTDATAPLWNGYARRNINGYVSSFGERNEWESSKYKQWEEELDEYDHPDSLKTLNHIACEDRTPLNDSLDKWQGVAALHTLKGDVDNLGAIFQKGMEQPTFARMAALSRQMNNFFALYLPYLCQSDSRFRNTYTVFAGGDDFFLIGPWRSQIALALEMRKQFSAYVGKNPDIHFSAGLFLSKPGLPVRYLGEQAEEALEAAKSHPDGQKNAVRCFGQVVKWHELEALIAESCQLEEMKQLYPNQVSTGFVYALLELSTMAGNERKHVQNTLWRSQLHYRVGRLIGDRQQRKDDETAEEFQARRKRASADVLAKLANPIQKYREGYHIALFHHLYQHRD